MNEAARIVDGLRDGCLDATGQQAVARRLAADPELHAAVRDEWRLQRRLAGLLADDDATALWNRISDGLRAGSSVSGVQRTFAAVERRLDARRARHRRHRAWRGAWWPMAAACAAAAILLAVLMVGHGPYPDAVPMLRLAAVQGEVQMVRAGTRQAAHAGMSLVLGDRVEVATASAASLVMADGTRLDCAAGSTLDWTGSARFQLDHGRVDVLATPRAAEAALAVATPRAVATVVGTCFTLGHGDDRTVLRVAEGVVRFDRSTTSAILVHAGEEAMWPAAPGEGVAITTAPRSTPPTTAGRDPSVVPQVVALCLVDAVSGLALPGWERIAGDVTVDLRTLPTNGWTVLAMTGVESSGAVQFRINGRAAGKPQGAIPYALTESRTLTGTERFHPWRPVPGSYRIEAIPCRSRSDATPVGRPLVVTITCIGE